MMTVPQPSSFPEDSLRQWDWNSFQSYDPNAISASTALAAIDPRCHAVQGPWSYERHRSELFAAVSGPIRDGIQLARTNASVPAKYGHPSTSSGVPMTHIPGMLSAEHGYPDEVMSSRTNQTERYIPDLCGMNGSVLNPDQLSVHNLAQAETVTQMSLSTHSGRDRYPRVLRKTYPAAMQESTTYLDGRISSARARTDRSTVQQIFPEGYWNPLEDPVDDSRSLTRPSIGTHTIVGSHTSFSAEGDWPQVGESPIWGTQPNIAVPRTLNHWSVNNQTE